MPKADPDVAEAAATPKATPDVAEAPATPNVDPDVAEAAAVAKAVLDAAFEYVYATFGKREEPADSTIRETIFAKHVSVQVARLQHTWTREGNGKTVAALEDMGAGLQNLSVACGKHSLHVKLVES